MPTTRLPSLSQASPLSSVHVASNHHTSLPWKKRPLVVQFKSLSTGPHKPGLDLAPPSLNGLCHPRQQQYFEQAAEKPTYPRADTSLPSPLEGVNPMGEVLENEGIHNPGLISCDQPCLFLTSPMLSVKILSFF